MTDSFQHLSAGFRQIICHRKLNRVLYTAWPLAGLHEAMIKSENINPHTVKLNYNSSETKFMMLRLWRYARIGQIDQLFHIVT